MGQFEWFTCDTGVSPVQAAWHGRDARVTGARQIQTDPLPNFAAELAYYRARKHRVEQALLVVIDADTRRIAERVDQIESECAEPGHQRREPEDRVAIFVAARNIETWLAYLNGQTVNEDAVYPKLERERDCQPHVEALYEMCRQKALRHPAPSSLEAACDEYKRRLNL